MSKLKIKRHIASIILWSLMASGCSLNLPSTAIEDNKSIPKEAFFSLTEDEQLEIESATPVWLMNVYFMGINEETPLLSLATLHSEYLHNDETLEGALELFEGYQVNDIVIEDHVDKNRAIDTSNTYYLIVNFEVANLKEGAKWMMGEGMHTYFVKLIKTNEDIWSIREMATSP